MKRISMQVTYFVPDNYKFEDGYKLLEDANMFDYDCQIIWTKEL